MNGVFAALPPLALCLAVGLMNYRFACGKGKNPVLERLAVLTIGIGFLMNAICLAIRAENPLFIALCTLGTCLSCTAVLLSFLRKEKHHE